MYQFYNPNPVNPEGGVGDCAIRAIAKALNISWEESYTKLSVNGFLMGDTISSDIVWGSVLREAGFKREVVPNTCPDCYRVADFCEDYPAGTYVIKSNNHVATVIDGILYDSWNSENKIPIYFWHKEVKE